MTHPNSKAPYVPSERQIAEDIAKLKANWIDAQRRNRNGDRGLMGGSPRDTVPDSVLLGRSFFCDSFLRM